MRGIGYKNLNRDILKMIVFNNYNSNAIYSQYIELTNSPLSITNYTPIDNDYYFTISPNILHIAFFKCSKSILNYVNEITVPNSNSNPSQTITIKDSLSHTISNYQTYIYFYLYLISEYFIYSLLIFISY